jgi:hypothetical protein
MMLLRNKDTSRKQGDSFRQQQETWRRAYAEALSLRERFPKVEQLVLDMAFTDLKALGIYSPQMRSFSAPAKAFFAIACPRTLCLDGGFDLDAVVRTMLARGATTSAGTLECQGWINPTRPDHARCLLQLHYRFEVVYDVPPVAATKRRTRA